MKGLRWAQAALVTTVLLSGCSGFWDKPSGTGGGGNGAASGVFYVMNTAKLQVAGFAFASGSSTPTAITNGSATFAATPLCMSLSPGGSFLYVGTGGGIFVYSVSSSGALTLLNSNSAISSEFPTAMAVDGTGSWLLESTGGSGVLNALPISASTGLLDSARSEQTINLPSTSLNQIAVSPANSASPYVFVAMGLGGTAVLPFNAASTASPFSSVSRIAVLGSGGGATAVAVDPTNRLLYVAETVAVSATQNSGQTGGLRVFTIGASSINQVTGSPYPTGGIGPSAILPTADGNFVYVANNKVSGSGTGNITGYPITSSGGAYSLGAAINTIAAGISTAGLAEDSSGTYLLAVNSGASPDLNTYTFDTTTAGKLVAGATAATGTDPVQATAIVAEP